MVPVLSLKLCLGIVWARTRSHTKNGARDHVYNSTNQCSGFYPDLIYGSAKSLGIECRHSISLNIKHSKWFFFKRKMVTYKWRDIRWKTRSLPQTLPPEAWLKLALAVHEAPRMSVEGRRRLPSCPVTDPSRSSRMAEWGKGKDTWKGELVKVRCSALTVNPPGGNKQKFRNKDEPLQGLKASLEKKWLASLHYHFGRVFAKSTREGNSEKRIKK